MIQGITKTMVRNHPDFTRACSHLSNIMKKVIEGQYNSKTEFREAMYNWIKEWSDDDNASPMSAKDFIINIGTH